MCNDNTTGLADIINAAQRRLLLCREAGDEGWWGSWAEVAFNVLSQASPYITCPREIARIEKIDVCKRPVPIQNQFMEYLDFGNGRMPKRFPASNLSQAYTRNNAVTFRDIYPAPQTIRIYPTSQSDLSAGRRVLIQGKDSYGNVVYSQDGFNQTLGQFMNVAAPFTDSPFPFNSIDGVQKDITSGQIQIFQVDPSTGEQVLLLTMEPTETVSSYRRYYLNGLPCNCCHTPSLGVLPLQVTAIVKLELIPVVVDTDYLLIQNLEAITEECQSVRYSEIDNEAAKKMAAERHTQAIRLLQGELVHYMGKTNAAVSFAPFGTAHLSHQRIGRMI